MEQQHEEWDKLEDLVRRKSFQDLSIGEKVWVLNFFESEQEYELFRSTDRLLENRGNDKILYPDKKSIQRLRSSLTQQHAPRAQWWSFSVPAYASAMLICICTAFGWWVGQSKPVLIVDRVVTKPDTVFVASKPDTVFVEKIIVRKPQEAFYSVTESNSVLKSITSKSNHGVSMKDNEELESLLVSGNGEGVF